MSRSFSPAAPGRVERRVGAGGGEGSGDDRAGNAPRPARGGASGCPRCGLRWCRASGQCPRVPPWRSADFSTRLRALCHRMVGRLRWCPAVSSLRSSSLASACLPPKIVSASSTSRVGGSSLPINRYTAAVEALTVLSGSGRCPPSRQAGRICRTASWVPG
jgi:hypothetical protein